MRFTSGDGEMKYDPDGAHFWNRSNLLCSGRALPGRDLPEPPGWYARAMILNACQLAIVMLAGVS